jgi:Ni/Co efflux regulator RcnB
MAAFSQRGGEVKRLIVFAAVAGLILPSLSLAQPEGSNSQGRGSRSRPSTPVTTLPDQLPGRPGSHPPRPRPPVTRPPNRPQFSWRGRFFNPIRGPAFRYPPGWGPRRWTVGSTLSPLFMDSPFYFNDWRTLGIGRPPPGRRWVRYGPDLLLVNVRTRRIEDVIFGVFF